MVGSTTSGAQPDAVRDKHYPDPILPPYVATSPIALDNYRDWSRCHDRVIRQRRAGSRMAAGEPTDPPGLYRSCGQPTATSWTISLRRRGWC